MRAKARKVVHRLMNCALVSSFCHMAENVSEQLALKTKSQKIVRLKHRLNHNCLVMCCKLWRHRTQEQNTLKAKLERVVYRTVNSFLLRVYGAWKIQICRRVLKRHCEWLGQQRERSQRIKHLRMCVCFDDWRAHTFRMKRQLKKIAILCNRQTLHRYASRLACLSAPSCFS